MDQRTRGRLVGETVDQCSIRYSARPCRSLRLKVWLWWRWLTSFRPGLSKCGSRKTRVPWCDRGCRQNWQLLFFSDNIGKSTKASIGGFSFSKITAMQSRSWPFDLHTSSQIVRCLFSRPWACQSRIYERRQGYSLSSFPAT
jgi:hypothetical protein